MEKCSWTQVWIKIACSFFFIAFTIMFFNNYNFLKNSSTVTSRLSTHPFKYASQKSTQKFLKILWFNFFYFQRKFTRSNKLQHDEIYSAVMCSIYSLHIMSCKVSWRMFSILFCLTRNATCLSFC